MGPLQDPVTWYGINYTGTQITQWDFQNKGKSSWTGKRSFEKQSVLAKSLLLILGNRATYRLLTNLLASSRLMWHRCVQRNKNMAG